MPVLIILAVLWAVVLLPPFLRSRSQHTADSIVDFNYKLDVLGRTNGNLDEPDTPPIVGGGGAPAHGLTVRYPVSVVRPSAAQRSARRRRDISRALALAVVCSLLLAIATQLLLVWALQVAVDVCAAGYFALWAWMRSVQAERLVKVRYIPELRVPELRVPEMALRRSASS